MCDNIKHGFILNSIQFLGSKLIQHDVNSYSHTNQYPIIGVLSQEISYQLEQIYPNRYKSFIAASYVKFVEGGGARVVPIWIGRPKSYYQGIMKKINGILFPGGSTWFHTANGYADAGEHIFSIAKEMNGQGDYFPLWGTCLGFELLSYVDADRNEHRKEFTLHKNAVSVIFERGRIALKARCFLYFTEKLLENQLPGSSTNFRILRSAEWLSSLIQRINLIVRLLLTK